MKSWFRHLLPFRYWPYNYLKRIVDAAVKDGVIAGPFKGLRYGSLAVCSSIYPKLLGTYEMELHGVLAQALQCDFRTFIDIGAAEGYYACGLARQLPHLTVIAYEADLQGRYLLGQNLALNALVQRASVRGCCGPAELARALAEAVRPALLLCDTEGYEYELLRPDQIQPLRQCHILVELHEFMLPGITHLVRQRFARTHQITEISARPRTVADFPPIPQDFYARCLSNRHRLAFLDEHRPPGMNWLWMQPVG